MRISTWSKCPFSRNNVDRPYITLFRVGTYNLHQSRLITTICNSTLSFHTAHCLLNQMDVDTCRSWWFCKGCEHVVYCMWGMFVSHGEHLLCTFTAPFISLCSLSVRERKRFRLLELANKLLIKEAKEPLGPCLSARLLINLHSQSSGHSLRVLLSWSLPPFRNLRHFFFWSIMFLASQELY